MAAHYDGEARVEAGKLGRRRMQRRSRVSVRDVARYRWLGLISEPLRPLAVEMERELGELLADKPDATAAERLVLEDVVRIGLILRGEFARYLEHQDPAAGQRVGILAARRASSLAAVGLERRSRELDLHAYIEAKAEPVTEPAE